jgi:SAM-dependent methyltransferase
MSREAEAGRGPAGGVPFRAVSRARAKVLYAVARASSRLAPAHAKRLEELAYWQERVGAEGRLENWWYEAAFTAAFGLDRAFYDQKRLLDVGCGPRGSLEWADSAAERIGLDPLAAAYTRLGVQQQNMRYVAARSEAMPFPDGYFDVVSAFNSLDHVDDLHATVRELSRVTRPGGTLLLVTDVNHPPTRAEPQSFGWEVLGLFTAFRVEDERRLEKVGSGVYETLERNVPYDESNPAERYGTLAARLRRL